MLPLRSRKSRLFMKNELLAQILLLIKLIGFFMCSNAGILSAPFFMYKRSFFYKMASWPYWSPIIGPEKETTPLRSPTKITFVVWMRFIWFAITVQVCQGISEYRDVLEVFGDGYKVVRAIFAVESNKACLVLYYKQYASVLDLKNAKKKHCLLEAGGHCWKSGRSLYCRRVFRV